MASASFFSLNGPTCTWNRGSAAELAMKTGYCFLRSAVTRISASSCLETAATCTINDPPAPFLASVPADGVTDWSGAFAVDDGWVAETSELLPAPASAVVAAAALLRVLVGVACGLG